MKKRYFERVKKAISSFLVFSMLLLTAGPAVVSAATSLVTYTLPDVTIDLSEGDSDVTIPLTVEGFEDILGGQLSINYDSTVLDFSENTDEAVLGLTITDGDGVLTLVWGDLVNLETSTIVDGGVLTNLVFDILGEDGDSTELGIVDPLASVATQPFPDAPEIILPSAIATASVDGSVVLEDSTLGADDIEQVSLTFTNLNDNDEIELGDTLQFTMQFMVEDGQGGFVYIPAELPFPDGIGLKLTNFTEGVTKVLDMSSSLTLDSDVFSYLLGLDDDGSDLTIGEYRVSLTGTQSGNFLAGTFNLIIDEPPYPVSSFPEDGSIDVLIDSELYIDFSEAVDTSTVDSDSVQLRPFSDTNGDDKVSVSFEFEEGDTRVVLGLGEVLDYDTQYYFFVGSTVEDLKGNSVGTENAWYGSDKEDHEFTTISEPDVIAPVGTVSYSTEDATNDDVVATLSLDDPEAIVTNNNGLFTYTFTENGSFTFEFEDLAGNSATAVAEVNNIDKVAPVITLNGESEITLVLGATYVEEGATAADDVFLGEMEIDIGGDVVDTDIIGTYIVTYNTSDNAGNNAEEVTRTVNVVEAFPIGDLELLSPDQVYPGEDVIVQTAYDFSGQGNYTVFDDGSFIVKVFGQDEFGEYTEEISAVVSNYSNPINFDFIGKQFVVSEDLFDPGMYKVSLIKIDGQVENDAVYFEVLEPLPIGELELLSSAEVFYGEDIELLTSYDFTEQGNYSPAHDGSFTIEVFGQDEFDEYTEEVLIDIFVNGGPGERAFTVTEDLFDPGMYKVSLVQNVTNIENDSVYFEVLEPLPIGDLEMLSPAELEYGEDVELLTSYDFAQQGNYSPSHDGSFTLKVFGQDGTGEYTEEVSVDIFINGGAGEKGFTVTEDLFDPGMYKVSLIQISGQVENDAVYFEVVDDIAPIGTITYSTTELTNQDVVATLSANEDIIITNNEGSDTYTFTENDNFVFKFEDLAGNTATAIAEVNNIDKVAPVIVFSDGTGNDVTLEAGVDSFDPETQTDATDDASDVSVSVSGSVDTNVLGDYEITYTAEDGAGNTATLVQTVHVVDTIDPVVTLNGDSEVTITTGDDYEELGATAIDSFEGDLDVTITLPDDFDTDTAGVYEITYSAEDSTGNRTQVVRTVTVEDPDTEAPVITLNGESSITLTVGDTYTEEGATAADNRDTVEVIIGGDTVDTSTVGVYIVTYNATDESGNVADEVTRTVTVEAAPTPVSSGGGGGGGGPITKAYKPADLGIDFLEDTLDLEADNVELQLSADSKASQMAISENENFSGVIWQDFSESLTWDLEDGVSGDVTVYAKFRTGKGEVSSVVSDTITINPFVPQVLGEKITDCPLDIGSAYKHPGHSGVWFITTDEFDAENTSCARRAFKNADIYDSYGLVRWSDVNVVSQSELEEVVEHTIPFIEWGTERTYLHGDLVKTPSDSKVYMLLDGKKHPISSGEVFKDLGLEWSSIVDVSSDVLVSYPTGSEIDGIGSLPEGTLFMYEGAPEVYKLEDGKQRKIKDTTAFKANGFSWAGVVVLPADHTPFTTGEEIQ